MLWFVCIAGTLADLLAASGTWLNRRCNGRSDDAEVIAFPTMRTHNVKVTSK
jgi:hypothetical protein